ncbi:riboflavin biosynthesis protein RibF [Leuconostoc falkenbergense]|uniref:riboflavin biosynthesis protein RibF n=1 Tax=Leuconostoc falkenbergense TaxID=2766470 RepID=UPI002958DED6|nr:riboflavin biosynthesis protein RibF [Leuconostoc falkenbergense]MDV8951351.1 riboflavin biosynthesis protein RibF [Leuconostoc falkenbergense]
MTDIIKLHYPIQNDFEPTQQVVAMGFFDGVHQGHQSVIRRAKLEAEKRHVPLAVLTYDPHPIVAFKMLTQPLRYLTPLDQKIELMSDLGVDRVYVMRFTSVLAHLTAQQFVDEVLMHLNPVAVVAGFDHLYGPAHTNSDMTHLQGYADKRFEAITVPKFSLDDQKIGSSRIRKSLDDGDVDEAARQLARIHTTTGMIVHGEARGRELGFPTANIQTPEQEWLPGIGIYAVKIKIAGQWYIGMASIGRNVTFGENRPVTVEINILNFHNEVYGEAVKVAWYHRLRGEIKFNNAEELIEQLVKDQTATQQYFEALEE